MNIESLMRFATTIGSSVVGKRCIIGIDAAMVVCVESEEECAPIERGTKILTWLESTPTHETRTTAEAIRAFCADPGWDAQCEACHGAGKVDGACEACEGDGTVTSTCENCDDDHQCKCRRCRGVGTLPDAPRVECFECSGSGKQTGLNSAVDAANIAGATVDTRRVARCLDVAGATGPVIAWNRPERLGDCLHIRGDGWSAMLMGVTVKATRSFEP